MTDVERVLRHWATEAQRLDWQRHHDVVYDRASRHGRWFLGGQLNAAANCLDRHLATRGEQVALHWEGEPGERLDVTYTRLHADVSAFAQALLALGVRPGMRVALHLGWLPETVVAMLACARIGAVHCVLPVPLPADALADRLADLRPRVLVTQDGAWRHGVVLPLKSRADEALGAVAGVEHTVVVRRTGVDVAWYEGDRWYHQLVAEAGGDAGGRGAVAALPADHPLLVTYLADQRGRPTGVVHRTAGTLLASAAVHRLGLTRAADDVYWCAVDIAWLAGQTHGVYGPLVNGATTVIYEGALDTPTGARTWEIIERYRVSALTTTPSVVRSLQRWTDTPPDAEHVASLRHIVTAGEPIEHATRDWLARQVGRGHATTANAWGQTELGGIVTVTGEHRGGQRLPDPGMDIVGPEGASLPTGAEGELVLRHPWPATFLGLLGGDAPVQRYWRLPGVYTTGDAARREFDGSVTFLGRLDPVVSVSGQLVAAGEVRDVLREHPFVADAVVVDQPDPRSGQAVLACVVLTGDAPSAETVAGQLRRHVYDTLGGLAFPRTVVIVDALPDGVPRRTLRRALRMVAAAHHSATIMLPAGQLEAAIAVAGQRQPHDMISDAPGKEPRRHEP